MSTALTDLLIEISDPVEFKKYTADPEDYMNRRGLSDEDRIALLSGDVRKVRWQARSAGYDERRNLFIQFKQGNNPESFHIAELHIEIHIEHSDLVAIENQKLTFTDTFGNLFRGRVRPEWSRKEVK